MNRIATTLACLLLAINFQSCGEDNENRRGEYKQLEATKEEASPTTTYFRSEITISSQGISILLSSKAHHVIGCFDEYVAKCHLGLGEFYNAVEIDVVDSRKKWFIKGSFHQRNKLRIVQIDQNQRLITYEDFTLAR